MLGKRGFGLGVHFHSLQIGPLHFHSLHFHSLHFELHFHSLQIGQFILNFVPALAFVYTIKSFIEQILILVAFIINAES